MYITDLSKAPLPERLPMNPIITYHDGINYTLPDRDESTYHSMSWECEKAEDILSDYLKVSYTMIVPTDRSGLHMCMSALGIKEGTKVFCSDLLYSRSFCPVLFTGGVPIFIDSDENSLNMSPEALKRAFELEPDVKHVMVTHTLGSLCDIEKIVEIAHSHGATVFEDAGEAFGSRHNGAYAGSFGDMGFVSFEGEKIISSYRGGAVMFDSYQAYAKLQILAARGRDTPDWYAYEGLKGSMSFSRSTAVLFMSQFQRMDIHLKRKEEIYRRYSEGLNGLPLAVLPHSNDQEQPNFSFPYLLIEKDDLCTVIDSEFYIPEHGKSCPQEMRDALFASNIESSLFPPPMHMREDFCSYRFIAQNEESSYGENTCKRCFLLPCSIRMTDEQQDRVIQIIKRCFL